MLFISGKQYSYLYFFYTIIKSKYCFPEINIYYLVYICKVQTIQNNVITISTKIV